MGFSVWQLVIILVVVLLVFGGSRLKSLGTDLGAAIKGFRSEMSDEEDEGKPKSGSKPAPTPKKGGQKREAKTADKPGTAKNG